MEQSGTDCYTREEDKKVFSELFFSFEFSFVFFPIFHQSFLFNHFSFFRFDFSESLLLFQFI